MPRRAFSLVRRVGEIMRYREPKKGVMGRALWTVISLAAPERMFFHIVCFPIRSSRARRPFVVIGQDDCSRGNVAGSAWARSTSVSAARLARYSTYS